MRAVIAVLCLQLFVSATAVAQPAPVDADAALQLDAVVVSGIQPGPGLWRVSKDDHVLWVMGTLSPLPKRMEWSADEAKLIIAQSQEVLLPPGGKLSADVGFFGGLALLPKAMGARKNPEKQLLADVLPADLYARWQPLKRKFLGRGKGIEKRRPLLAANKLFDKAVSRSGLTLDDVVEPLVRRAAKRAKVTITHPIIEIKVDDPKQALKEISANDLEDIECFSQTLDRLESDLGTMRDRANAWAVGDIDALRALPFVDQRRSCTDALLNASFMRDRGLGDLRDRIATVWLDAAENALSNNLSTFAVLPIDQILRPDGYIDTLRARGYVVEAPQ